MPVIYHLDNAREPTLYCFIIRDGAYFRSGTHFEKVVCVFEIYIPMCRRVEREASEKSSLQCRSKKKKPDVGLLVLTHARAHCVWSSRFE